MADFERNAANGRGVDQARKGRDAYARRAWAEAYRALSDADQEGTLGGDDLEQLAIAAYLIGREQAFIETLGRAYHAHMSADDAPQAIRCAFFLGMRFAQRGETAHASGWLSRAARLADQRASDGLESGYLMLPVAQRHLAAGDPAAAQDVAGQAAALGDRFGDAELAVLARQLQGRCLILSEQVEEGLALLDESMLAVSSDTLSPLVTGIVYCSVIEGCRLVSALDRAREWTDALADWCAAQPDLHAFTGSCLVHRAEILELQGFWPDAADEARRAAQRLSPADDPQAYAAAWYELAELHRLRGRFADAEDAYRKAGETGWDPQPGLALLRLAQGRAEDAMAALRRALSPKVNRVQRVRLLPAQVEVLLATGDTAGARQLCGELSAIVDVLATEMLRVKAAHVEGAVALAEGDAAAALDALRRVVQDWLRLEAPYHAARARELMAGACRALGDEEGGRLELEAARTVFKRLGALPDLARLDASVTVGGGAKHGLTQRERQVLRLVAAGKPNKAIAGELGVSVRTVDRHVSNIFDKLDVPSRAAATAFAYEHGLA